MVMATGETATAAWKDAPLRVVSLVICKVRICRSSIQVYFPADPHPRGPLYVLIDDCVSSMNFYQLFPTWISLVKYIFIYTLDGRTSLRPER